MTVGLINLRGLLGDNIITQLGWRRHCAERPEWLTPLTAVVPDNGPFRYLQCIAQMSPCVNSVIPLDMASLEGLDEAFIRLEAVKILHRSGVRRLLLTESEDTGIPGLVDFYREHMDEVCFARDLHLKGYINPVLEPFRVPKSDMDWALGFRELNKLENYIVVHNRQPGWGKNLKARGSNRSGAHINNSRNFALEPLIRACEAELPADYKLVRMGDPSMDSFDHPRVVDISSLGLSLCRQAALIGSARFFIGGNSGATDLANALETPLMTTNVNHPCGFYFSPLRPSIVLEKQLWMDGRRCDFTETPLVEGGLISGRVLPGLGYEIRENSVDELSYGLRAMLLLLDEQRPETWVLDKDMQLRPVHRVAEYYMNREIDRDEKDLISLFVTYEREVVPDEIMVHWGNWDPCEPLRIGLLGAGGLGRKLLSILRNGSEWSFFFFDSDTAKWGTRIEGVPVHDKNDIATIKPDAVLITTSVDNGELESWVRQTAPGIPVYYYNSARVPQAAYRLPRGVRKPIEECFDWSRRE